MVKAEFQNLLESIEDDLFSLVQKLNRLDNIINPFLRAEEPAPLSEAHQSFIDGYAKLSDAAEAGIRLFTYYNHDCPDDERDKEFEQLLDAVNAIEKQTARKAAVILENIACPTSFYGKLCGMKMPYDAPRPARAVVALMNEGLPESHGLFIVDAILDDLQFEETSIASCCEDEVFVTFNGVLSYDENSLCVKDVHNWVLKTPRQSEPDSETSGNC